MRFVMPKLVVRAIILIAATSISTAGVTFTIPFSWVGGRFLPMRSRTLTLLHTFLPLYVGFPRFKLSLAEHVPHDLLRRVVSQEGRQKEQLYLRDCVEQTRYFTEYVHDSLHFVGVFLVLIIIVEPDIYQEIRTCISTCGGWFIEVR